MSSLHVYSNSIVDTIKKNKIISIVILICLGLIVYHIYNVSTENMSGAINNVPEILQLNDDQTIKLQVAGAAYDIHGNVMKDINGNIIQYYLGMIPASDCSANSGCFSGVTTLIDSTKMDNTPFATTNFKVIAKNGGNYYLSSKINDNILSIAGLTDVFDKNKPTNICFEPKIQASTVNFVAIPNIVGSTEETFNSLNTSITYNIQIIDNITQESHYLGLSTQNADQSGYCSHDGQQFPRVTQCQLTDKNILNFKFIINH